MAQTCPPWCRSHGSYAGEGGQPGVAHRSAAESWSDRPERYVQLVRLDSAERPGRTQMHIRAGDETFALDDMTSTDVGGLVVAMLCLRADSLSQMCGAVDPGTAEQSA